MQQTVELKYSQCDNCKKEYQFEEGKMKQSGITRYLNKTKGCYTYYCINRQECRMRSSLSNVKILAKEFKEWKEKNHLEWMSQIQKMIKHNGWYYRYNLKQLKEYQKQ